jgi:23S rRNA pseudouridine1911/1915/1917 synthase
LSSIWEWNVGSGGERADLAVMAALSSGEGSWTGPVASLSRSSLKRLFEEGAVLCDGKPLKASAKPKPGSRIRISVPEAEPTTVQPEARELSILFEDEHLLVVNKPQGLTVHPSPSQLKGTLVGALLHRGGSLSQVGGPMRPGIVHRIDKDTSGALVITRTDVAHRALVATFSKHAIERTYWALCYGTTEKKEGRIESTLGRNPADRKKMAMDVKDGKKAVTLYRRIEEFGTIKSKPFASYLELSLQTGRTHQIRVHLTGLGCSILGDRVYGAPSERQTKWQALPEPIRAAVRELPGQALHARTLGFEHPITGKRLSFTAEPPPVFTTLLEALRKFG